MGRCPASRRRGRTLRPRRGPTGRSRKRPALAPFTREALLARALPLEAERPARRPTALGPARALLWRLPKVQRRRRPGPRRRLGARVLPRRPRGPSTERPACPSARGAPAVWPGGWATRRALCRASVSPKCWRRAWITLSVAA
eukprot:10595727-Alexandrium_andersonii.AAC.1